MNSDFSDNDSELSFTGLSDSNSKTIRGKVSSKSYNSISDSQLKDFQLATKVELIAFDGVDDEASQEVRFTITANAMEDVLDFKSLFDNFVGMMKKSGGGKNAKGDSLILEDCFVEDKNLEKLVKNKPKSANLSENLDLGYLDSFKEKTPVFDINKVKNLLSSVQKFNKITDLDDPVIINSGNPGLSGSKRVRVAKPPLPPPSFHTQNSSSNTNNKSSNSQTPNSLTSVSKPKLYRPPKKLYSNSTKHNTIYQNTNISKIQGIIKDTYLEQTSPTVLKTLFYFRSGTDKIAYRYTSSAMIKIHTELFSRTITNVKQLPVQIDLPAELEECAISGLLAYCHGEELVVEDDDKLQFYYIGARYLKFDYGLVLSLRGKMVSKCGIDPAGLREVDAFVDRLIPPRFHVKYKAVKDPNELPFKK